jgi:dimethylglycine dehydrogenase
MALIDPTLASPGTALTTHIVGAPREARVIPPSPYDPAGKGMRG